LNLIVVAIILWNIVYVRRVYQFDGRLPVEAEQSFDPNQFRPPATINCAWTDPAADINDSRVALSVEFFGDQGNVAAAEGEGV